MSEASWPLLAASNASLFLLVPSLELPIMPSSLALIESFSVCTKLRPKSAVPGGGVVKGGIGGKTG